MPAAGACVKRARAMVDMVDMVDMGDQCFFSSVSSSSWVIKVITSSVLQAASARGFPGADPESRLLA